MLDREFKLSINTDAPIDLAFVDKTFHDVNITTYGISKYVTRNVGGTEVTTTTFVFIVSGPVNTDEPAVACACAGAIAKHHSAQSALVTCAPLTAGIVDEQGRLLISKEEADAIRAANGPMPPVDEAATARVQPRDVDGSPIPPTKIN